jgi:folate-binding protein YgfZ
MTMTPDELPICHPDTGFISVVGDEACAFLQSIITANVETLPIGACRPTALLTPQGRVLIDLMVYRPASDHFLLRSDAARRDNLFTRLRRYRLRRPIDLVIEPDIRLVLLLGNQAAETMTIPMIMSCSDPRSPKLGSHCLVEAHHLPAQMGTIDSWHATRIAAGVPEGPIDLTPERALMLEAGLDRLGAVDFEKGCYVGQEVTARTHYRGLVKRRLVPLTITGDPPAIDSDITWQGSVIGKSKTAAALTAPIAGEYEPTDTQSICLALLKLSDIHNILDAPACGDGPTTNSLMINGYAAVLALADWMQPLPHQAKSQG